MSFIVWHWQSTLGWLKKQKVHWKEAIGIINNWVRKISVNGRMLEEKRRAIHQEHR